MQSSRLEAIITRLKAMLSDDSEIEVRRFEKEGVEKCIVRFNKESESFELEDLTINETFQFDDIDLVAMEIYELIQYLTKSVEIVG